MIPEEFFDALRETILDLKAKVESPETSADEKSMAEKDLMVAAEVFVLMRERQRCLAN